MPVHRKPLPQRPKGKTPQERSIEFDAEQARLRAEAAARRAAKAAAEAAKPGERP